MTEMQLLDHFFAKRLLKGDSLEENTVFLSTLMRVSRDGHLCWKTATAPQLPAALLEEGKTPFPEAPVIRDGDRYYLQRNWAYETTILEEIKRLKGVPIASLHDALVFQTRLQSSSLLPLQKEAVERAFQSSFSVICGGPGTGKTFTASVLVDLLLASKTQEKYKVVLAAPTGKAASHLHSALKYLPGHIESTTLHRLLRIVPGENRLFSSRKIDADLLIIDEASMIDVPLLAQLFASIGNETRVVLMGDPDQLPPVEAGSLFREIAALFGTRLQKSMRTEDLALQRLAMEIQQGELAETEAFLDWKFDSHLITKLFDAADPLISWEEPMVDQCLAKLSAFRILGALRQGPFGIDAWNRQLVERMNQRIRPGQWWAIPIMITANEPRKDLYNGDCGILIGRSSGGIRFREAIAYFPEKIPHKHLPPYEVAFCLSIHKSQGSEFEKVLALFPQGSEHFGREALYTAVTRAKKEVKIGAEKGVLLSMLAQRAIKISGFTERYTRIDKN